MRKRAYNGRTFIRERVIVAGDRMEVAVYPVFQPPGKRRGKCKPTKEIQRRINERNSIAQGVRIAEANFGRNDYALHLTYKSEPEDLASAQKILSNFLQRLRHLYARSGIDLKWMKRTETGKTSGRIHHHLFITGGVDRDKIEALWGQGYANSTRLQPNDGEGIEGLARYISGAGKKKETFRRWSCSRNCVRPEVTEHDGRMDLEAADALGKAAESGEGYQAFEDQYPGWECVECEGRRNESNGGWYTYAVLRRRRK